MYCVAIMQDVCFAIYGRTLIIAISPAPSLGSSSGRYALNWSICPAQAATSPPLPTVCSQTSLGEQGWREWGDGFYLPFFCLLVFLLQASHFHAMYLASSSLPACCPSFHSKFIGEKNKNKKSFLTVFFFLTGAGWQNRLSNSPLICYYPAFHTQKCRFPCYLP